MEELKLHNKTHWLYTHFFHFFDIPHFLPYELVKKFLKHWNKYFNSRDDLADSIEEKEKLLSSFNINDITSIIDKMTSETNDTKAEFDLLISNHKSNIESLDKSESSFESMLNGIIDWQNNYGWKTT